MTTFQNSIDYLLQKARFLSQSYEEQTNTLTVLGDYITEDIANDWIEQDLLLLQGLLQKGIISPKALDLYREIDSNFANASYGRKLFEAKIWSLDGLKNHAFWAKQRELARQLFLELQQAKF